MQKVLHWHQRFVSASLAFMFGPFKYTAVVPKDRLFKWFFTLHSVIAAITLSFYLQQL